MMTEPNGIIPPWHSATKLFEYPAAKCELILDGYNQLVSIVLWEGYCYLKLADLQGLWGITQPYDGSDLVQFVAAQIEAGEVGRVWDFSYTLPAPPVPTSRWSHQVEHVPDSHLFRLVAIVRFDNSALVREWQQGPFLPTPAFSKPPRAKRKISKANPPSIWLAGRKLVGRQQIGSEVSGVLYRAKPTDEISQNELFNWKQGSLPELIDLLQALCICAYVDSRHVVSPQYHTFSWPLQRGKLNYYPPYYRPQIGLNPFLRLLWDEHHFDSSNWVPANGIHYAVCRKTRQYWKRPMANTSLVVPMPQALTSHQRLEAALTIGDWFQGKISKELLDELFRIHNL